ncbi:MAG TPA: hypothetical protein VLM85_16200, partial [Polyangiaceae bacterium]|nr:hypothetical protein [Polyangiaceae bacterium]
RRSSMRWFQIACLGAVVVAGSAGALVACSGGDTTPPGDGGSDAANSPDSPVADSSTTDSGGSDGGVDSSPGVDASALDCNYYCSAMATVCTGANAQYLDTATCAAICAKLTAGDAGATSGDTLACRMYHLSLAATSDSNASLHCPHAGPYGFGQCGTECEDFCALYAAQCGSTGWTNCASQCAGESNLSGGPLTDGADGGAATSGNTVDCREYYLEQAYKVSDTNDQGNCKSADQNLLNAAPCN